MVIERTEPTKQALQQFCLDKGYNNKPSRVGVKKLGYRDHIRRIGEENSIRRARRNIQSDDM
jgi:hypothetical protein